MCRLDAVIESGRSLSLLNTGISNLQSACEDQRVLLAGIVAVVTTIMVTDCVVLQLIADQFDPKVLLRWGISTVAPCIVIAYTAHRFGTSMFRLLAITSTGMIVILVLDFVFFPAVSELIADVPDRTRAKLPVAIAFAYIGTRCRCQETESTERPRVTDPILATLLKGESIRAAGNYVEVCHEKGTQLVRLTMSSAEERLVPHGYVRVHRSWLVKSASVVELCRDRHGLKALRLVSGSLIPIGRTYRASAYDAYASCCSSQTS